VSKGNDVRRLRDLEVVSDGLLDRDGCPSWCEHEHGDTAVDFHHDGEMTIIYVTDAMSPEGFAKIYVNVSQNVPAESPVEPPYVEVQDEHRTLLLLTPVDCLHLARALLERAGEVAGEEPGRQDGAPEVRGVVAQVMDDVGSLFTVLNPPWASDVSQTDEEAEPGLPVAP
jgi:hypothetical protein